MALEAMTGTIQSGAKPDPMVQAILMGRTSETANPNSPDEHEIVKLVGQMFQKAKNWKNTWAKDHDRWWNLWESNHYKGRTAKTITQAVINQIWSSIETFVGHVVDSLPEPLARPRTLAFKRNSEVLTKWLKYEADSNDLQQEVQHPVRSACVTGAGWMSVEWDPTRNQNRGDVVYLPIDEKFVFPAPYARNLQEALYLIEAKNVPREYVVRTWERGEKVPPGTWDGSLDNLRAYAADTRDAAAPNLALLTTTTGSDSRWTGSSGVSGGKRSDLVTLMKCYIRQNDDSMRLVIVANGVLLQDGPSPYDDDDFPYVVFNVIPTLDTIQGRGLVQFVEGLQKILNDSVSYLLDQQRFASDPMLGVATANLEEVQLLENDPGSVLPDAHLSAHGSPGYYWLQGPGINQAWVQIQELINDYMDSVLGRVDVLRGERPVGVSTLGGLEIVRDQANVRLRSLVRWIKASLKRLYLLTVSRLRQFATEERIVRISGPSGREEFVTVNPVVGVQAGGQLAQERTIPEEAEFDVEFGKDAPGGKQAKIELALALAGTPAEDGLPMVDRQFVLDQAEIQEAPEVMERLAALGQAQAQAQAGAQAGGPAAGANPMDQIAELLSGGQAA